MLNAMAHIHSKMAKMITSVFFHKTMRMTLILLSCMTLLGITSCATFSDKNFRNTLNRLEPQNVLQLSGVYAASPLPMAKPVKPATKNLFYQLIQRASKDQAEYDKRKKQTPLAQVTLHVSLIAKKQYRLTISYRVSGQQVEQSVINANLHSGMLELDNAITDCHGVPYVLGGCKSSKVRVGLTQEGNLIVNSAHDNSGALLLVIGSGYDYNTHHIYQRLQKTSHLFDLKSEKALSDLK